MDPQKLPYPRWVILVLGFFINAAVGMTTYAWSLFIAPLQQQFGWSRTAIALAFSICCLCYGAASFVAGRLTDRYGPKMVVFFGGLLLGCGFFLTGYIQEKWQLYLTYGLMSGCGAGLIYLPPVGLAPKWWPDRKALATGVIVLGLGIGSSLMAPVSNWIIENLSWRYVFRYCGVIMALISCLPGLLLTAPPDGWSPHGRTDADQSGANGKPARYRDYTYEESIRSGQFWLLYLTYFFTASAGLLVTGHIAAFGTDSGLTPGLAAGAVMALTITNAATRVGSGYFADRFGSKRYFTIISLIQGAALGALYYTGSSPALLWLTAAVIGWNYGAIFTLFPALCVQFFGSGAQNSNYGLLFTAWGIAGFFGPFSGGFLRDMTGTYITPFIMASALGFLALILVLINRPPAPKEA